MRNTNALTLLFQAFVIITLITLNNLQAQDASMSLAMVEDLPRIDLPAEATTTTSDLSSYEAFYPGGKDALANYLKSEVKYPALAQENNFEGTTKVLFEILPDGTIGQIKVTKSTHAICDEEVTKAIRKMKNWKPAQMLGRQVKSWQAIEVDFYLQ